MEKYSLWHCGSLKDFGFYSQGNGEPLGFRAYFRRIALSSLPFEITPAALMVNMGWQRECQGQEQRHPVGGYGHYSPHIPGMWALSLVGVRK